MKTYDAIIIGGGQSGLALGYYLKKLNVNFLILDDRELSGGGWQDTWDSLKLFSPTEYSSIAGWQMPKGSSEYPTKNEFIDYLTAYETRYQLPVVRPASVTSVTKQNNLFNIKSKVGTFRTRFLISATGTSKTPFIPTYINRDLFQGAQIHSIEYRNSQPFDNQKVLVVGSGNSGAQILAEVSKKTETIWVTQEIPSFLADDVDGRYLFNSATERFQKKAKDTAKSNTTISLSNIVMVESVKEARARGDLSSSTRPFKQFYDNGIIWADGSKQVIDAVIWCTGFKANLNHLKGLNIIKNGQVATNITRSIQEPNLWLLGYGAWTGFASSTIYGVTKTARSTAMEIKETLKLYLEE